MTGGELPEMGGTGEDKALLQRHRLPAVGNPFQLAMTCELGCPTLAALAPSTYLGGDWFVFAFTSKDVQKYSPK